MKKEKYVAYYRVSTQRQGQSGLGLEAQKEEIQRTISGKELIKSFTDIESGSKANRPELDKALAYCKKEDATLIIAKLDRLSRDVSFIFNLRDSGVKFKACDLPDLNTVTLGVFASFAQYERDKKGTEAIKRKANQNPNNQRAMAYIEMMIPKHYTLEQMANELNNSGFKTSRGKEFTPMQVSRLKKRIDSCRVD